MIARTHHPERIAAATFFRMQDAHDRHTHIRLRGRYDRLVEICARFKIHDAIADEVAAGREPTLAAVMRRLGGKPNPAAVQAMIDDPEIPAEVVAFLAESEAIVRRGSLQPVGNSKTVHWVPDFGGEAT